MVEALAFAQETVEFVHVTNSLGGPSTVLLQLGLNFFPKRLLIFGHGAQVEESMRDAHIGCIGCSEINEHDLVGESFRRAVGTLSIINHPLQQIEILVSTFTTGDDWPKQLDASVEMALTLQSGRQKVVVEWSQDCWLGSQRGGNCER